MELSAVDMSSLCLLFIMWDKQTLRNAGVQEDKYVQLG